MTDLLDRLQRASISGTGEDFMTIPERMKAAAEARAEIERLQEAKRRALHVADERSKENVALRALLKHADDVVIWEHTPARSGFQEEIEAALGIGNALDVEQKPHEPATSSSMEQGGISDRLSNFDDWGGRIRERD